jgi:FMN phosphatase YigB (HAD superfamily)
MNAPAQPFRAQSYRFEPETLPAPTPPEAILPHELPGALAHFPQARVLSLDCFDTLLWRDTHAPVDIFARLPGTTPMQRRRAESQARRVARFGFDRHEVAIGEIYAELLPNASAEARAAAVAAELAAEARHCFAFAPAVALMRSAKAKGMQVIIVSDTYLDANQLRELIARSAGEEVAGLIDRIFVSSVFGKPKAGGLYGEVLRKLSARPHEILHIGDNKGADVTGVAPFGVATLHLRQFSEAVVEQLRLEAGMDAMLHRHEAEGLTTPQPHRAALALAEPCLVDPARRFGFAVLGPAMAGFAHWLAAKAEALRMRHGGTIHPLFLMRDGHLPMQAARALLGEDFAARPIEISRFTATAASFTTERAVQHYLEQELGTEPAALARQLLIPEAEIESITAGRDPSAASHALLAHVRRAETKRAILAASRGLARRLVAHVRAVANPQPGDTLMLVDLGYNGTVQNRIAACLEKELKVHVAGRFLLLREMDRPGLDKRGLIDAEHYEPHALEALCANVAVLEQLCTTPMGSTVDYTEAGDPIRRANGIKQRQSAIREGVQAGAIAFITASKGIALRRDESDAIAQWRRGVASGLARLMYLPQAHELAVISAFEHDVNLGTERKVALFDPAIAAAGLRERGLFYLRGSERMYLPAELAGEGLAPRLTLFAAKRWGLPFSFADFAGKGLDLPVIFIAGEEVAQQAITATPTHDGWYLAAIPIGDCRFSAAICFGAIAEWLELGPVRALPMDDFLAEIPDAGAHALPLEPSPDGMESPAPGLWRCAEAGGFLMVPPPARTDDTPMLLTVPFRPIIRRPIIQREATRPTNPGDAR